MNKIVHLFQALSKVGGGTSDCHTSAKMKPCAEHTSWQAGDKWETYVGRYSQVLKYYWTIPFPL